MMLCKLSFKNIAKSVKDYAIYFFTITLGVAIFYVFNAIESQTVMLNVSQHTMSIIELMNNMLAGVSVFVSFILGFLIIYASRFLMKRRNKEFGIYLTLGMSKRKVSLILFIETLIIGIISLLVGLIAGVFLSQLMSILVSNMFEADMTSFEFVFSPGACVKCLIYFGIMYLIVMIFNTLSVSKCRLIDLLYSNKKSEKIKLKNPWLCVVIFIISASLLGYAYYLVTAGIDKLDTAGKIFIPVILGSVSTFLIFFSLSGLVLRIVMSVKKIYYKGLNSFILRQISSKINTAVFSMTIICLMLFVTICVLSSSLSVKNSMTANLDNLAPADLQLKQRMNLDDTYLNYYTQEQIKNSNLNVLETFEKINFDLEKDLKDIVSIYIYQTPDVTMGDTLGSSLEEVQKNYKFLSFGTQEEFIRVSDYNKLALLFGGETYMLKGDEYIIIADFDSMIQVRNIALKNGEHISVFGHDLAPKYDECKDGIVEMSAGHINTGIILIPDEIADEKYICYNLMTANYRADSKEEKQKIEAGLYDIEDSDTYIIADGTTRLSIAGASLGLGGMVTFIGLYLGIIFLISCAAILALKELSESGDNKERYDMLRKIGADERLINKALFRQIGIFFMCPLILAIIHSVFGIKFCNFILETFGNEKLLPSILMTAGFMIIIYGGYFWITYLCSKSIIKNT